MRDLFHSYTYSKLGVIDYIDKIRNQNEKIVTNVSFNNVAELGICSHRIWDSRRAGYV